MSDFVTSIPEIGGIPAIIVIFLLFFGGCLWGAIEKELGKKPDDRDWP